MVIDQSELDDFKALLKVHGLSQEDFELSSTEDRLPQVGISPETGRITVKYKKTGIKQTYRAGHGTAWVVEFEKDLDAGRFA